MQFILFYFLLQTAATSAPYVYLSMIGNAFHIDKIAALAIFDWLSQLKEEALQSGICSN